MSGARDIGQQIDALVEMRATLWERADKCVADGKRHRDAGNRVRQELMESKIPGLLDAAALIGDQIDYLMKLEFS